MRERGWKWSQATVWSIEKGERPLRLAEAEALADVLGEHVSTLLAGPSEGHAVQALRRVKAAHVAIIEDVEAFLDARDELAHFLAEEREEVRHSWVLHSADGWLDEDDGPEKAVQEARHNYSQKVRREHEDQEFFLREKAEVDSGEHRSEA